MSEDFSFPKAFTTRIKHQLGDESQDLLNALQQGAINSFRLNQRKGSSLPFKQATNIPWQQNAFFLPQRPIYTLEPTFHAGAFYVQEASSMMVSHFLPQEKEGLTILDLCAAPGGKSTLLLDEIPDSALYWANETIKSRAIILEENLIKWGRHNVVITQNDPKAFRQLEGFFDVVLVDAPCSGEGLFRKDNKAINEWTESLVELCAGRQRRILSEAVKALKPGGSLIYCTCTFAPKENQENVNWLLKEFGSECELMPVDGLSAYGASPIAIGDEKKGAWQCFPHKVNGEGFFISRLYKKEQYHREQAVLTFQKEKPRYQRHCHQFFEKFIHPDCIALKRKEADKLFLQHPLVPMLEKKRFKWVSKGVLVGHEKRKGMIPSHALALSVDRRNDNVQEIALKRPEALKYLKRMDLQGYTDYQNGLVVNTYNNIALGWGKLINGKIKNQFPVQWRIRMEIPRED